MNHSRDASRIVCFIAAVSGSDSLQPLFRVTLGMTVAIPILLYAFILILRLAANRAKENLPPAGNDAEEAGITDAELDAEALSFAPEEPDASGEEKRPAGKA